MERSQGEGRLQDDGTTGAEERRSVRADIEARLRHGGVTLSGDESDDQLASMSEAVEAFDAAVMAVGGDRMVDSPDSSEPEHRELVIPPRADDESPDGYIRRVREAADRVAARARPTDEA